MSSQTQNSDKVQLIKQFSLIGCSLVSSYLLTSLAQKLSEKNKNVNEVKSKIADAIQERKLKQESIKKEQQEAQNIQNVRKFSGQQSLRKQKSINIDNFLQNEEKKQPLDQNKIYKICITGGPCSGKTSGIVLLAEKLREEGFLVFTVPEAYPLLVNSGAIQNAQNLNEKQQLVFYKNLLLQQSQLEDTFIGIAKLNSQKSIVLCERGLMDNAAYLSNTQWQTLLSQMSINEYNIRDQRYDCVVHLVTAADGAENNYNKDKTNVKRESPEQAIDIDKKVQLAWLGHPMYFRIENKNINFEEKLQQLVQTVRNHVGLPVQLKKFNKRYLIQNEKDFTQVIPKDIKIQKFFICDSFLQSDIDHQNPEHKFHIKIRRRGQESYYSYSWFQTEYKNGQQIGSQKKQLNFKEYLFMLSMSDKSKQNLLKERICFMQNGLFYIIDTYVNSKEGFSILKVKVQDENQPHLTPEFVKIIRDVTGQKSYKSRIIAKKNWYAPEEDEEIFNIRKDQDL